MSPSKDILNITLNILELSDHITLRLSVCAFCLIPGAQNHFLLCSCKIQPCPWALRTRTETANGKGLGIRYKIRFGRTQGQVTSKQRGQPCKIDCSGHSLVGGGGSQPEQSMLVASFGGTKVWVCVFKGQPNPERGSAVSHPGWETHGQSRGISGLHTWREQLYTTAFYIWRSDSWWKDNMRPVLGAGITFWQLGWHQPYEPVFPSKLDRLVCGPFLSGTLPAVWMKIVFLWKYFTV